MSVNHVLPVSYYAIQRFSDGAFLPAGRKRGFTHDKPTKDKPPRLFTKKSSAEAALRWWKMGTWTERYSNDCPELTCQERPERKDVEMEVVEIKIGVVYPQG